MRKFILTGPELTPDNFVAAKNHYLPLDTPEYKLIPFTHVPDEDDLAYLFHRYYATHPPVDCGTPDHYVTRFAREEPYQVYYIVHPGTGTIGGLITDLFMRVWIIGAAWDWHRSTESQRAFKALKNSLIKTGKYLNCLAELSN